MEPGCEGGVAEDMPLGALLLLLLADARECEKELKGGDRRSGVVPNCTPAVGAAGKEKDGSSTHDRVHNE
jgi:hypothetical protein